MQYGNFTLQNTRFRSSRLICILWNFRLSMGASSLIWEHMSTRIESTKKINEKKKCIILHALKTGSSLPALDSIKGSRELKTKRENIQKQIESSEIDVAKKEFVNRQLGKSFNVFLFSKT